MHKVITLVKRRSGMPVDEFQRHWRERHAPLVAAIPGLRRYVQSHALPQGYAKGELVCDGIEEAWFDDPASRGAALGSAEARRADEHAATFTDRSMHVVMPVDVIVIVDGAIPAGGVKNVEFVNRRPGMELHAFRAYWERVHGPLASGIALMRRYEQNHLRLDEYDAPAPPRYDGLAITWFDSTADMKAGVGTDVYERTRADERNFLPDGHLPLIVTREHVIVG